MEFINRPFSDESDRNNNSGQFFKSLDEEVDRKKFITDQAAIKQRLSMKPIYLYNVSADDFKLPAPPANSSAQTRAELNFLVELERSRTEEDIRRCHYMSGTTQLCR